MSERYQVATDYAWTQIAQQEYYRKHGINQTTVIDLLESHRVRLHLSTKDFAKLIGETHADYKRWISGRPPKKALSRITQKELLLREGA